MFAMPTAWRLAGLGLGFLTPVVGRSRRGFGGFAFALGDATAGAGAVISATARLTKGRNAP